jgi:hypothetical protein
MAGTVGPLETRAMTTFDTPQALAASDATPYKSGEIAYVVSLGHPFMLVREDTTTPVDNQDVIAVGPPGSAGRWKRLALVV